MLLCRVVFFYYLCGNHRDLHFLTHSFPTRRSSDLYWKLPDATRDSFADGWYRTGDVARVDTEGFVTVLDRIKDMLIRGGENIYCTEIEDRLTAHADVVEAAVFGIPDRVLGEVVGAAVDRKSTRLNSSH